MTFVRSIHEPGQSPPEDYLTPEQRAVFVARVKVMGNSREEALRHARAVKPSKGQTRPERGEA